MNNNKYYGMMRARVVAVDIEDENAPSPNAYGAIRVFIPSLMVGGSDNDEWSDGILAYPANCPMGGPNYDEPSSTKDNEWDKDQWYAASAIVPSLSSWVWVFFEDGDVQKPFYLSGVRCQAALMPIENRLDQQGTPQNKPSRTYTLLKTHDGRSIVLSDSPDVERVEITGRKRWLSNSPISGGNDADAAYCIDNNQTTILLDEREGLEKILLRSWRGDFIHFDVDQRQLSIYFKGRINIATQESMFLAADEDINIVAGKNVNIRTATGNINMKSIDNCVNIHAAEMVNVRAENEDVNISAINKHVNMTAKQNMNFECQELLSAKSGIDTSFFVGNNFYLQTSGHNLISSVGKSNLTCQDCCILTKKTFSVSSASNIIFKTPSKFSVISNSSLVLDVSGTKMGMKSSGFYVDSVSSIFSSSLHANGQITSTSNMRAPSIRESSVSYKDISIPSSEAPTPTDVSIKTGFKVPESLEVPELNMTSKFYGGRDD